MGFVCSLLRYAESLTGGGAGEDACAPYGEYGHWDTRTNRRIKAAARRAQRLEVWWYIAYGNGDFILGFMRRKAEYFNDVSRST